MRSGSRGPRALLWIASALVACAEDPTEIVVVVQTNLAVPGEIDAIRIDVREPDGDAQSALLSLGSADVLPGRLGVRHTGGDVAPLEVTATGLKGERAVVSQRARTGFVPRESRVLEMLLLADCVGSSCAGETTCEGGACIPIERGPLPPWRGSPPAFDAGPRPADAGESDAGPDAPADAGPDAADPCDTLRRLPSPPEMPDEGGDDVAFYATHLLDYGTALTLEPGCPFPARPVSRPRTALEIGYDLDGARTGPGEAVECAPSMPMIGPGADGCGGVDNVIGQTVYAPVAALFGCELAELGDFVHRGSGGFLVWVRGWNGTPNDRRVEVAVLPVAYGRARAGAGDGGVEACEPSTAEPPPPGPDLGWDGTDVFYVLAPSPGAASPWDCELGRPSALDQDAYVRDGLLVSNQRRNVRVRFGVCAELPMGNPLLTARITPDGLFDGVLQARVDLGSVRAVVGALGVPQGEIRESIDRILERNADLNGECSYSERACEADPAVVCDAMSGALGFESVRAVFGGVRRASRPASCDR